MKWKFLSRELHSRPFAVFGLLLLFLTIFTAAFHYHENSILEDDCPICRFQQYIGYSDDIAEVTIIYPEFYIAITYFCTAFVYRNSTFRTSNLPNAPPLS